MRVVLVYPGISISGFDSYCKGNQMEGSWISHGLCSLSSNLKSAGFEVELVDLRALKDWESFADAIERKAPDVVGISMMSVDFDPAMRCADLVKKVRKEARVVLGGVHPTVALQEVEDSENIDHIITGEGEITFTEMVRALGDGQEPDRILHGVKPELDRIPFVDRELFPLPEGPILGFPAPFVTIIAGRGCRYNCRFCQPAERKLFGSKVRRRSVDNVIEELKVLRDTYSFESLMIHDDCLTEDRRWVVEFCEKYAKNGFHQPFICQNRADIIVQHEDMIRTMSEAGLRATLIGFESGSQRVLDFLRKGAKVEENYRAAEICRKYGIAIWANYMLGIPTETKDEVLETVRMIKAIEPDTCSPTFYTPHPGSDLYDYVMENDLSLISSHSDYARFPTGAKIKGVDYQFLRAAMEESLSCQDSTADMIELRMRLNHLGEVLDDACKSINDLNDHVYRLATFMDKLRATLPFRLYSRLRSSSGGQA